MILEQLMYKSLHNFLTESKIIYDLQFGFRQNFPTKQALINLTENIQQTFGRIYWQWNICRPTKAFHAVDHDFFLAKFNHYGIRVVSNKWFKSSLSNGQQFVSTTDFDSNFKKINCDIPQGH